MVWRTEMQAGRRRTCVERRLNNSSVASLQLCTIACCPLVSITDRRHPTRANIENMTVTVLKEHHGGVQD
jgi:hypothetical protein